MAIITLTLACVVAVVWLLARSSETDAYLAVLSPHANSSTVLASNPSTCGISSDPVSGVPAQLVSSFLAANAPGSKPISLSALNGHFAVADSTMLNRYTAAGASRSVLLHGRDLVNLSRVGFNSDRSEGLFCVEGREGGLLHVRMQNGHWQLVNVVSVWSS